SSPDAARRPPHDVVPRLSSADIPGSAPDPHRLWKSMWTASARARLPGPHRVSEEHVHVQDNPIGEIWDRAVTELQDSPDMSPRQLAFVRLAHPLGLLDGTVLLAVADDHAKDYLESRVRAELTEALTHAL